MPLPRELSILQEKLAERLDLHWNDAVRWARHHKAVVAVPRALERRQVEVIDLSSSEESEKEGDVTDKPEGVIDLTSSEEDDEVETASGLAFPSVDTGSPTLPPTTAQANRRNHTMSSDIIYRQLGKNGPKVAALGFGAMGFTTFYGNQVSDEEAHKVIKAAVDEGCTFIATSIIFGPPPGKNERLLGELLKDPSFRSKVFISTGFGSFFQASSWGVSGKPEFVRQCCDDSLSNLQVDSIDLYYQHRVDRTIPIEETWGELKKLKEEGKVKHLGISEATAEEIRRAHAVTPISAVEIEFSPWTPDIKENGILDACRELGIAIVAYSPLGRGFLTGAYKSADDFEEGDLRRGFPRFQGEAFKENLKLVDALKQIADKKGVTPGQLTLAWVLAQGADFFAIPGTKKVKYLKENIGARSVELTEEEMQSIDEIVGRIKTVGERYGAEATKINAF